MCDGRDKERNEADMLRRTSLSIVAVATARHRRGLTRDSILIWQVPTSDETGL